MLRIGQSQLRYEDDALLRGAERFTSDAPATGALALVFVRAAVGAGVIRAVDARPARATPGVRAIFTGADLAADGVGVFEPRLRHPGPEGEPMRVPPFPPLAVGATRYVGDPVAMVIADSRRAAEDAAEAVRVEIDERPGAVSLTDAAAPDAPRVWEQFASNHCFRVEQGDGAAVSAAIAGAAHVVRRRLSISRVTAAAIEPRGCIAAYDGATGRYRLELGTQTPHRMAPPLAAVLGTPPEKLHVIGHACGGGFGAKNAPYPEYAAALWAARQLGAPLRWSASRLESFLSDAHAREQIAEAALALDAEGRFLGLGVAIQASLGAYLGPMTAHPPVANLGGLAGVYRTPAIHVVVDGYFTNTQNMAPYRGAGRPEATYVIERLIDEAARDIGIDRVTLRRRNLIQPAEMPFKTGLTFTYDCGDFPGVLDQALAAADWNGIPARRAESADKGLLRGAGIVNPIEISGGPAAKPFPEYARILARPDGALEIAVGSRDTGQGHVTAFRQIVSGRLGLAPERISVTAGDTDQVAKGAGSFGSRTMMAAGTALWRSADRLIETLTPRAAEALEAAPHDLEFVEGVWRVAGTDRTVPFSAVLAEAEAPIAEEVFEATDGATFPNGCHICEVEVDPATGRTRIERYTVVDDVGVVVNPLLLKGQIVGGVAQGAGQALMEQIAYDPETGQLLTGSFMDYAMPRALDLPGALVQSRPTPTQTNPLGVKGAGEAGTVGALPAVMNAICDALASAGAGPIDMPATPARVWTALAAAQR